MSRIRVNVNDVIRVKLTEFGRLKFEEELRIEAAASHYPELQPTYPTDEEGYTRMRLWEFMKYFGKYYGCGVPAATENCQIIFEDKGEEGTCNSSNENIIYYYKGDDGMFYPVPDIPSLTINLTEADSAKLKDIIVRRYI